MNSDWDAETSHRVSEPQTAWGERFLAAVVDQAGRSGGPLALDYRRLNLSAVRPGERHP